MTEGAAPEDAPRITVIVVNWNGRELLPNCLQALRRQSMPADRYQVLVVDNGSDDGSVELLREREDITLVEAGRNLGFGAAVNLGLAESSAPLVVLLNNDATADPSLLQAFDRVLSSPGSEGVAAVTGRVLLADGQRVNSTGNQMSRRGRGSDRDWLAPSSTNRAAGEVFGFCGAVAALRRSALDQVGGFDGDLFLYYEDTDLAWRLRAAGWTVQYEPAAVAHHRHAASSGEGSPQFTFWNERNSLVVFTRHAPARLVLAVHLWRLVGLVVHTIRGPRSAATSARWRAMGEHLARLPRTLSERRRIWADASVPRAVVARWLEPSAS
jgi:GT2 family glycosyltransferase